MRRTAAVAFLFATLLTAQRSAEILFQQAMAKERGQSDIKGAITLFQQIAADKNTSRPLAARHLWTTRGAGVSRFSPDGKLVAFDGAELRLINADGTGLRTIAKSQSQLLAWTPDAKQLAVNEAGTLHLISVATGQKREILRAASGSQRTASAFRPAERRSPSPTWSA